MGTNKYTDEYLKTVLLNKRKELGRTPKKSEVPHCCAIAQRFGEGNWNKALENIPQQI